MAKSIEIAIKSVGLKSDIAAICAAVAPWPPGRWEKFCAEWHVLKANGAEEIESGFSGGVVSVWISDDYIQHCRKFGIKI